MSSETISYPAPPGARLRGRARRRPRAGWLLARPELLGLLALSGALNLWNLGVNGWANTYYSAAVRSMSSSWHNFLYASLDPSGLMTVDKPPLSLWVQALSVRGFGFHPLSILVPEALMGMATVALVYDMTRRRFGRIGGFVAGLALALTPISVAISRHNNPDALLVLCCVAAVWSTLRALDTGRTRWLVAAGACVGLGFETKMGVALLIVPGIAAAWLWVAPRGRAAAMRQLLVGGVALVVVGGAWPLLVTLTPAAHRPWISGTSDNSIWSLIFGYNGLGRIDGQAGGPGGMASTMFGGPTGIFRLLQAGLGDQAGWLLGSSLAAGASILGVSRLRRRDPRSGWLIVVGGAFLTTAVVFSFAHGIFHPYYVSFLAPFAAALLGAGVGLALRASRLIAPLLVVSGAITELVVLGDLSGQLSWAAPLVVALGGLCALVLGLRLPLRARGIALALALAALFAAPAAWAADTLAHAANGTFPAGGAAAAAGAGGFAGLHRGGPPPAARGGLPGPPPPAAALARGPGRGGQPPGGGQPFGSDSATLSAVRYATEHGGGTIGVSSQSSAASAILSSKANIAGLGGFSGRESSISAAWVAAALRSGHLRWILVEQGQARGVPGDTRTGSRSAFSIVERVCRAVTLKTGNATSATMYDCLGRASAITSAARR